MPNRTVAFPAVKYYWVSKVKKHKFGGACKNAQMGNLHGALFKKT
jgi:hypothetical protein